MDNLYNLLYKMFSNELLNMNIGYNFNEVTLEKMTTLIHVIDFIKRSNPTSTEIIKLIEYYDEI